MVATCELWSHAVDWERRIEGVDDLLQTEVCKTDPRMEKFSGEWGRRWSRRGGGEATVATTLNALWPTITTKGAAVSAALISAASTLSAAFVYLFLGRDPGAEPGTPALLFPALLMIIAWRTWRLSRRWSLFGAILAGVIVAASLFTGPDLGGILIFFAMITGYRGARAWHRFSDREDRGINASPDESGIRKA
jgi:hypothetical protein